MQCSAWAAALNPTVQINAWFITNRNPETGEYPDLPPQEEGGSAVILQPPLPTLEELLADKTAAPGDKKGGKGGSKPASAAAKKGTGKDGKGGKGESDVLQKAQ